MLAFHPIGGDPEPLTGVYDCTRKRTTDGDYSLSFSIDRTETNAEQFDALQNKAKIECENELFVIDDVQREPLGDSFTKTITANHEMFDRLQANGIKTSYTATKSINDWLETILAGTGLDFEVIGNFDSQEFDNFGMTDSLTMFKNVIEQFECEYRVVGTHLVIAKLIGDVTDAQFRHGHNLKTFSDEYDTSNGALVTEVIAYGKNDGNGNPTISVDVKSANFDKFERPYIKIIQDERFTVESSLQAYAESLLSDGNYSAKVEYQELVRNGLKLHNFDIGDYIYCIYELSSGVGIDLQPRIVSIEDYPEDPTKSPVLELGNFFADITRNIMGLNKAASQQVKLTTDTKKAAERIDALSAEAVRYGDSEGEIS
ncbi:phage tail protein [Sporolactobacillus sp. KGMB 08714]|uniref:phage tail protein n=1 Tax=Sporolactobacillus sp. KGMB 08714 TaxID=3064704 RepID=UPI002FBD69CC